MNYSLDYSIQRQKRLFRYNNNLHFILLYQNIQY